ncbi:hypothetical protein FGADI_10975 [Fusarium gaditjirri]|uniref:NACHT domain-containing protein n=1 Tax=Fusarium gaditjirri TaxID=282569 RepID=A0A8H4WQX7_9HYPO|nr:hypothetical protein FGADI_10975 [Fusarium gaditjirri]
MAALDFSTNPTFDENDTSFSAICEDAIKEFLEDPKTPKPAENRFVRYVNDRKTRLEAGKGKDSEDDVEQTEEFIRQLEQEWTGSKAYNLRERVEPFIKGITSLIKSCESLLQPAPFGAAIAVSGFRIVLELSTKAHEAVDEILNVLEEVQPLLACYKITAASQQSSPDISRAIKKSFKTILELWAHSAKILSKSYSRITISNIIRPLKDVIQDFQNKARKDAENVNRLLLAHMSFKDAMQRKEERKDLLRKWIIGGEKDDLHADTELKLRDKERTDGTCKWIFEKQEFKDWRDARKHSVLWYNGPPGSGKSVLVSAVINHLREQPESEVVYFFYTFKSASTRQETCGLRSIALQLLRQLDATSRFDRLTAQYDRARKDGRFELGNNDCEEVVKLLTTLLQHSQFAQVYVVLDGLDECSIRNHGENSFPGLQEILSLDTLGTVKWFLSSRDIPEMRSLKEASKAVELKLNLADTSKDIETFLDSQDICPMHDEPWFDTDEHIFLYAAIICKIVKDKTYGTKEEMLDALRSFPEDFKDLKACYLKSLARIKDLPAKKRNLAIRTFRLLAWSEKQLTLMEFADALNLYINPKDESAKSKEDAFRVFYRSEDVCSPLITMDDTDGSHKVSLFHKSVKDFFIEPNNQAEIEKYLPGFYISELEASEHLGVSCIEYLSNKRYQKPESLKALVTENTSSYGNAFLRYAAVFWHIHLCDVELKPKTLKSVTEFLKSPGFWTCMYVQSHTAPHLFARYKKKPGERYQPMMGTTSDPLLHFGLPLPPWKEEFSSADYRSLDYSFCAFVQDWGELLAKNPDQLHHAVPLNLYEPSCRLKAPNRLRKVHIKHISNLLESTSEMHILESSLSSTGKNGGRTLQLHIICEEGMIPERRVKVNQVNVSFRSKHKQNRETVPESLATDGEWITTIARDYEKGDHFLQNWKFHSRDLSITRYRQGDASRTRLYQAPSQVCRDLGLDPDGKSHWNLVQLDVVTQPNQKDSNSKTRLFYFRQEQGEVHCHGRAKSPINLTVSNSDSQNSSSDSDGSSYFSSDLEDDLDSIDTLSIDEGKYGSLEFPDTQDGDPNGQMTECVIMASDFGKPIWRPIRTDSLSWTRMIGARHPRLPIVAVSYRFGQVDVFNDDTGFSESFEIPEKERNEATKLLAVSRELQFSPCGNFFTLLSIGFYQEDGHTKCQVTASCFEFLHSSSRHSFQAPNHGTCASFVYSFLGKVDELPRPYIMTNWTPEHVVLALPPWTYSPKIIKISLLPLTDHATTSKGLPPRISTLTQPVFFPQSTISRDPHIMTRFSGPVVMRWKVVGHGTARTTQDGEDNGEISEERHAWREWNNEDQVSEDAKVERSALEEYRMLRGDFVGETYTVPIRSGLDWTREGVLSC